MLRILAVIAWWLLFVGAALGQTYTLQPDPSSIATPPGGNTTAPALFFPDLFGHLVTYNVGLLGPVVSACGATPNGTLTSGDDVKGVVTTGGGATTQCTITFSNPYANTPTCIAMQQATTTTVPTIIFGQSSSSSASAVVFNHTSATAVVFDYICFQ